MTESTRRNPPRACKSRSLTPTQEDSDDSCEELSSSSYHTDQDRATSNDSTPERRKPFGSSTASKQKLHARASDPNQGRCLLTNATEAITTCHVIAASTKPTVVRHSKLFLESSTYIAGSSRNSNTLGVWIVGSSILTRVVTCFSVSREVFITLHNLTRFFPVRADWHFLFDQDKWMLVPEHKDLEMLRKSTITEAPRDRSQIDLNQVSLSTLPLLTC